MILLFPDMGKRAPRLCERCEKHEAEFGPYCLECYEDIQGEKTDNHYNDLQDNSREREI